MAETLKISDTTLTMILILIVLTIWAISLSLLCIFKKNKLSPLPKLIDASRTIPKDNNPNQVFKPSKGEIEILLLYKGDKKLFEQDLLELSTFSTDKTKLYFKRLYDNGFINSFSETETQYLTINMVGGYRYTLTQKGREYLHDNDLLD